jgi:hypothetical protein
MSCAAFTGLTIALALWPDQSKVNGLFIRGCGALAVLFFVLASYGAWKQQRDLFLAELAKNQNPELRGEAYDFARDPNGTITHTDSNVDGHRVYVPFSFTLAITNHRPVNTNLSKLIIDGREVQPPIELWKIEYPHFIELEYAKIVRLRVTGTTGVEADPGEIGVVRLDNLKVAVVDGLGDQHDIPVHPGSQLPLRSF